MSFTSARRQTGWLMTALSLVFSFHSFQAKAFEPECYRNPTAKTGLIYLHGLEPNQFSSNERKNREMLKTLSQDKSLGLAVALPKSATKCGNKYCWQRHTKADLTKNVVAIAKFANSCWSKNVNKQILVGFSNGGYFVIKLWQECLNYPFNAYVAAGAKGVANTPKKNCAPLHVVAGRDEYVYGQAKGFFKDQSKLSKNISFHDFKGGHWIPRDVLLKTLK